MKFFFALFCVLVCCQVSRAQNATAAPATVNELFSLLGLINTQQNYNNLQWGQQAIAGDRITVLQPTVLSQLANYQQIEKTQQQVYSPLFSLISSAESELAQLNQELAAQKSSTTASS